MISPLQAVTGDRCYDITITAGGATTLNVASDADNAGTATDECC